MTTTSFLGLKKPADSDAIDISAINYNADIIDAFAAGQVVVSLCAATSDDNPTKSTASECAGIMLTATVANSNVGIRIFAGTSGQIFMQSKDSVGWLVWNEVVSLA